MSETPITARRIAKNLASLSTAELLTKISGTILYLALARHLGPEGFGTYSVALTFGMTFAFIADLGFDTILIRDVARNSGRMKDYFGHCLLVKLCGGALAFLVGLVVVGMIGYPQAVRIVIILGMATLFISPATGAIDALFKGLQRMGLSSLIQIMRSGLVFACAMALIVLNADLGVLVSVHAVVAVVVFLVFYAAIFRMGLLKDLHFSFDRVLLKEMFRDSFPFFMLTAIATVYARMNILMLSKLGDMKQVGLFTAAEGIIAIFGVIPGLASVVLFPLMSQQYASSSDQLERTARYVYRILAAIGVPLGFGLLMLAPQVLDVAYGAKYVESVSAFRIMGLALGIGFAVSINGWLLAAVDQVKVVMWINVANVFMGVLLNFLLIPRFGAVGAAATGAICATSWYIATSMFIWRRFSRLPILQSYCRPIAASLTMAGVLYALPRGNVWLLIAVSAAVYCIAFYLLRGFSMEEWQMLRRAVRAKS